MLSIVALCAGIGLALGLVANRWLIVAITGALLIAWFGVNVGSWNDDGGHGTGMEWFSEGLLLVFAPLIAGAAAGVLARNELVQQRRATRRGDSGGRAR